MDASTTTSIILKKIQAIALMEALRLVFVEIARKRYNKYYFLKKICEDSPKFVHVEKHIAFTKYFGTPIIILILLTLLNRRYLI